VQAPRLSDGAIAEKIDGRTGGWSRRGSITGCYGSNLGEGGGGACKAHRTARPMWAPVHRASMWAPATPQAIRPEAEVEVAEASRRRPWQPCTATRRF
jgi:hypothetical protein